MKKSKRRGGLFGEYGTIVRVVISGIIMAALIVSFYGYVSSKLGTREEGKYEDMQDELQICLTQDFINNYPKYPRDVVVWYNRIITLFYSEKLKNKEIEGLCDQLILLMDQQMQAQNPRDVFISGVKQDIKTYEERKRKIVTTNVELEGDVEYTTANNGDDLCFVTSYYLTQEASQAVTTYQTYCLKRDGAGRYKILSFRLTDANGN